MPRQQNSSLLPTTAPFTGARAFIGADITLIRGRRCLCRDVHFNVAAGGALALYGANGAGKSSFLRGVAGLLAFAKGRVYFDSESLDAAPLNTELHVGVAQESHYIGHKDGLKNVLSVDETLAHTARFLGGRLKDITPLRAAIGLGGVGAMRVQNLSAGQRRRLALARLVLARRRLWLLDEPFAALDAAGREWLTALIGAHLAAAGMVLVATHEQLPFITEAINLSPETAGA